MQKPKVNDFMSVLKGKDLVAEPAALNAESAIEQIKKFQHRIAELKVVAKNHVIKDAESQELAVEMIAQVKELHKAIEAKRKELV